MSSIKERIIGAVTIMNEEDAAKVWDLIQATFVLSHAEKTEPDAKELEALHSYYNGAPDYQPSLSQDDLLKELGL